MPHTRHGFTASSRPSHSSGLLAPALLLLLAQATPLLRADTTISNASTSAQTLSTGTLTIAAAGSLTVSSTTNDITVTGSSTIVNLGTLKQTGTGRDIRDNNGSLTLTVTNGSTTNSTALMQTADGDVIQMNKANSNITFNNYGTLNSLNASAGGNQAIDFNAITTGTNILNNYSTGLIKASEADAVRPGVNGVVNNYGTILSTTSTGSSSDGVDAQTNSGVTVTNGSTGLIEGGRHGITGGNTTTGIYSMTITNSGTIKGDDGAGVNIDGLNASETVTITNSGTIQGTGLSRDGDGVDVDGLVNLTNQATGVIRSVNSYTASGTETSEGVTVGGGTITNYGLIEGDVASGNTSAVGRGITIGGVDTSGTVAPMYANTVITNYGTIRGQSDAGIAILGGASGFTVTIDNKAGALIEGNSTSIATVSTGADNDTVTNAGSIINDQGSGAMAISLGAGNDTLNISGGSAVVVGGIDGGTGTNTLNFNLGAANNTFSHDGVISNFSAVNVNSGVVTLSGNVTLSSAASQITVASGATLKSGGTLTVSSGSLFVSGSLAFDIKGATAGGVNGFTYLLYTSDNLGTIVLDTTSSLLLTLSYTPQLGQQFELIDIENASTFVSGTFAGLSEGALFYVNGTEFQISYFGGTGNDVVVTAVGGNVSSSPSPSAVPEPATNVALLGAGVGLLGFLRRRRQSRRTA